MEPRADGHTNRETRRPNTTVDVTASEGTNMARHNELETMPHSGKLARSVVAALLVILPLAASTCLARPAPRGPHPRFGNSQQAQLGLRRQAVEARFALQSSLLLLGGQVPMALQPGAQVHSLPEDRQRMVRKAFRDLREYPPEQRQALMNSGQFQAQFTQQERSILAVEPYHPIPKSGLTTGCSTGTSSPHEIT
jgi:hypothetical protein